MRTDTIRGRFLAAACIVFHLLVAGVVPVVDASLEARASDRTVHVEAEREGACAPGHNHLVCQLCRTLTRALTDRTSPSGALPAPRVIEYGGRYGAATPPDTPAVPSVGARAPPRA